MELLLEAGPDAIHHAGIASAAGVSRTTLYKYWPTRAKLLLEVLTAFDAHPEMCTSGDIRADLVVLLSGLRDSMADPARCRVFTTMLAQAQWDDDILEAKTAMRAIPMGGLSLLLDAAVSRGEIRSGLNVSDVAARLLGPLMFGAVVIGQDIEAIDVDSIIDDWLATVRT